MKRVKMEQLHAVASRVEDRLGRPLTVMRVNGFFRLVETDTERDVLGVGGLPKSQLLDCMFSWIEGHDRGKGGGVPRIGLT